MVHFPGLNCRRVHQITFTVHPATDPQWWRSQLTGLNWQSIHMEMQEVAQFERWQKSIRQKPIEISSKVQNPTETTIINQHLTILIPNGSQFQIPIYWPRVAEAIRSVVANPHKISKPRHGSRGAWNGMVWTKQPNSCAFLGGTWWEHRSEHVPCITCTHAKMEKHSMTKKRNEAELEFKPHCRGILKATRSKSVKHWEAALTQFLWCCLVPFLQPSSQKQGVSVWCPQQFFCRNIATSLGLDSTHSKLLGVILTWHMSFPGSHQTHTQMVEVKSANASALSKFCAFVVSIFLSSPTVLFLFAGIAVQNGNEAVVWFLSLSLSPSAGTVSEAWYQHWQGWLHPVKNVLHS